MPPAAAEGSAMLAVQGDGAGAAAATAPSSSTASPRASSEMAEACKRGDNLAIIRMMQDGMDVASICPDEECAPIHIAAAHGRVGAVTLLSRGCDLDLRSASGGTALHCAALNGRVKVARQLLLLGANPNAVDHRGCTPLIIAAYTENPHMGEVVKLLLGWGAMPQMRDDTNRTAADVLRAASAAGAPSSHGRAVALNALMRWPHAPSVAKASHAPPHVEAVDLFPMSQLESPAEVKSFSRALKANRFTPKDGRLDLSGSNLSPESAACLGQALAVCDTVTELVLAGVLRSAEHAAAICGGLEGNVSVSRLDLSGSDAVGVAGMRAVGQLLAKNRCLRRLDLSHSIQHCGEVAAVAAGVEANVGLEELVLEGSNFAPRRFGGPGVKPLVAAVRGHRTLALLSIARSVGCGVDLHELPAAVQSGAPALRGVDVTDCGMTPRDMRALIDAVKCKSGFELRAEQPYPQVLQKARELHSTIARVAGGGDDGLFDITFNGCITDGIDALLALSAVAKNSTIASLSLQQCRLGAQGVAALAELVAKTTTLSKVNLASSLASPDDVLAVVKGLARNASVKYLNLHQCPVTPAVHEALTDCLTVNCTLLRIKGMSDEDLAPVEPYLEVNRAVADPRSAQPGLVSRCIGMGKLGAIRPLLTKRPELVELDPHSNRLHALLMQQENVSVEELHALYRCGWCFDEIVAGLVKTSRPKFNLLQAVCCKLAEERWSENGTGRTILHVVLEECRFATLEEVRTLKLARAIIQAKPDLESLPDNAGVTPAEIAAGCNAPQVQSLFMVGIITALQRKGRELKAAEEATRAAEAAAAAAKSASEDRARLLEFKLAVTEQEIAELRRERDTHQRAAAAAEARAAAAAVPVTTTEHVSAAALKPRRLSTADSLQLTPPRAAEGGQTEVECEIECVEFDHLGATYWLDLASRKVYSDDSNFVGKLTEEDDIDFGAEDSDAEDNEDDDDDEPAKAPTTSRAMERTPTRTKFEALESRGTPRALDVSA